MFFVLVFLANVSDADGYNFVWAAVISLAELLVFVPTVSALIQLCICRRCVQSDAIREEAANLLLPRKKQLPDADSLNESQTLKLQDSTRLNSDASDSDSGEIIVVSLDEADEGEDR